MTRSRIVTLNIRHGGGTRIHDLTVRLLRYLADVLVITEFQAGKAQPFIEALDAAGYRAVHSEDVDPKRNTVLIASRRGIDGDGLFDSGLDPHHLYVVDTAGLKICGAYLPVNTELRRPQMEALIAQAQATGVDLIIGDFNTGNNDLDRSPTGSLFPRPEMLDRLKASGYRDLWRDAHPDSREYSYYSQKNRRPLNGFRVDHAFALPEVAQRVVDCRFDHTVREGEHPLTDHSALIVDLGHPHE